MRKTPSKIHMHVMVMNDIKVFKIDGGWGLKPPPPPPGSIRVKENPGKKYRTF